MTALRAVTQLTLDLPRAWPNDRVLLPRQWHAALGYVLTVPHHTPDGRPVDTYAVGRRARAAVPLGRAKRADCTR